MAIDLAQATTITSGISALSNLLIVSPQNTVGYQAQASGSTNAAGSPFLFNYEGEQAVHIQSDITDHFIEDNTALQDQIALRPEEITTHGFIGELNDVAPFYLNALKSTATKLTTISSYFPSFSATALLAYNEAVFLAETAQTAIDSAISTIESIGGVFTGSNGQSVIGSGGLNKLSGQNKQQQAFQTFYNYWFNRVLFTVQTPWAVFQNMAIKSLKSIQDAETRVITDFEITFKMIRTASTQTTTPLLDAQGRLAIQGQNEVNLGNTSLSNNASFPLGGN